MKNDLETSLRVLEDATAAGDRPTGQLDAETASLREGWLAFGEMLEAAQPATPLAEGFCRREAPPHCNAGALVKATPSRARRRWQHLLAAGLLAASLLAAATAIWMLSGGNRQGNPTDAPKQMASTKQQAAPSQKARAKAASTTESPQWDDSLDEQIEQVNWQMLCVRGNEAFRTDAFGQAQYRLERLRETIQADSL